MSISSVIVSKITSFRNPNGPEQVWTRLDDRELFNPLKVIAAEVGYIATIVIAIAETALSAIAKLFSLCLPMDQESHEKMSNWVSSSAFSIGWALADSAINLFANDMIETERVARACAASGDILTVPMDAL